MKPLVRGISLWLCVSLADIRAQSTPPVRLEFEVASVKPHPPDGNSRVSMTGEHGRISYTNVTVRALIRQAYGLKVFPLSRGPDALSTDRYDIAAKAPGDASKEQTMLMLQTLLEQRFKLVIHRETKELPIYTLVVARGGPKIHPVEDDGSAAETGSGEGHQIKARHVSMRLLAGALQRWVGDTVVDGTGLAGLYDLNLDFNPDESMSAEGPTLFEAVERQLGLKLQAGKGPVEVVVIDHVEKPSGN